MRKNWLPNGRKAFQRQRPALLPQSSATLKHLPPRKTKFLYYSTFSSCFIPANIQSQFVSFQLTIYLASLFYIKFSQVFFTQIKEKIVSKKSGPCFEWLRRIPGTGNLFPLMGDFGSQLAPRCRAFTRMNLRIRPRWASNLNISTHTHTHHQENHFCVPLKAAAHIFWDFPPSGSDNDNKNSACGNGGNNFIYLWYTKRA